MIVFRTDGNASIGAGHVMRCLAIADEAKESGENCLFIISSDDCSNAISNHGHAVSVLGTDYSKMTAEDELVTLEKYKPKAIFVDSYFVTLEYMGILHDACLKNNCILVYIDDRCVAPYRCDVLINYNIFGNISEYERLYSKFYSPKFLLGASYAPLRKEFNKVVRRTIVNRASNILVSTGGTDIGHLTIPMVEEALRCRKYCFHFVVGIMNPDRMIIECLAKGGRNVFIHKDVVRMDKLMCSCEVAISAAGSTLYELCATSTPSITYIIADNQIPAANAFEGKGLMKNCGDIREMGNLRLARKLIRESIRLANDIGERRRLSEQMNELVDGNGVKRIMKYVLDEGMENLSR